MLGVQGGDATFARCLIGVQLLAKKGANVHDNWSSEEYPSIKNVGFQIANMYSPAPTLVQSIHPTAPTAPLLSHHPDQPLHHHALLLPPLNLPTP